MPKINTISDVVSYQLCVGCGVCAYLEPDNYAMIDCIELGRRPELAADVKQSTGIALQCCPGIALNQQAALAADSNLNVDLLSEWGPVLEVWEGYASDEEIRFSGSSGGVLTALGAFCVEKKQMSGVLHTAAKQDVPYQNETVLSTNRDQLLARSGSRYAPASPAEKLSLIANADKPCAFIGKPCDVVAAQNARKVDDKLDSKLGLTISFFCAGTPSTRGTLELFRAVGVTDPDRILDVRYRGNGWPGMWALRFLDDNGNEQEIQRSYEESWGFLESFRQWRCYICPDHTGEFADVSVGDPWYRPVDGNIGRSLIVARTELGRSIINDAVEAGYIKLERNDASLLPRSQNNLRMTRAAIWGRLVTMGILGAAVPQYRGFSLFASWRRNLPIMEKVRSFSGTAKRVFRKGLHRKLPKEALRKLEGTE